MTENRNLVLDLHIFYIYQEQFVIQGRNQRMAGIGVIDKVSKVVILRFAQPVHPRMQRAAGGAIAMKFPLGNHQEFVSVWTEAWPCCFVELALANSSAAQTGAIVSSDALFQASYSELNVWFSDRVLASSRSESASASVMH